ncbi:MAG TPA: hypothetical protein VFG07_02045, partial [Thermoplasmata archaeon]|nr:hypothetical protein [Thermoplasmata archaeon]
LGCSNATGLQRDWGVSVARSTDGGQTFGPTEQLTATQGLQWESFPTNCTSFASNFYYLNVPERPALAINPATGVAILTWDQFHANINTAGCSDLGTAQVMYSTSSDGGKTWSTPKGLSGDLSELSQVSIGPSPSYTVTATFLDFQNGSGSAISIEATSSSNSGSTWSTPKDVVLAGYYFPQFPSGAGFAFGFGTILSMTADGHAGSLYSTHVYEAWADNGNITTNPGYATIEVSVSSNSGTSFAPPVAITPVSTSTIYVEPTVTTDDQGVVWVTFLGITISSGNYNTYGVLSTDGGTTWSSPFLVSDSVSTPGSTINDIGLYTGAIGTSNGAYPVWTDCSSASCAVSADAQLAVANVHTVSISANITGVNATISTFGASKTSKLPTVVGWDNASTSTVTVPQFLPDPANSSDVYTFQAWSGISTSPNYQASVTYSGTGSQLVANYAAVPAAVIRGTIAPNVPGLALKVNNAPVSLTPYNATALQYLISVPGGLTYTLVASAPNYASQTHPVQTSQSGTYYWNFTLTKRLGYFVGQLTPSSATLKVNGSVVTTVNPVTGLFNIPEPFGWYWLNASGTGLTASNQYLEVLAGQNVTVNIVLIGGWVQGVVLGAQPSKPGLLVKIDGVPIPVSAAGTFNNSTLGGFHTLTATQAGFNLSSMSLFVAPGHATLVNVTLTNRGWISGIIQPAAAVKTALLHIYSGAVGQYYAVAADGTFNVSLVGNPKYTVNVTSTGYTSFQNSSVAVTPGNGTDVSVTLTIIPTGCTSNCGSKGGGGNNATPSSGLTTTELILIVVVIVVVAAVAVVLLMRRRGGGSAPEAYDEGGEGGQVYESSNPADLPRLQSDGTMGPGNPPPPPS